MVCPCEKGRGQGMMSPGLLPAATFAAALELWREPWEMVLTRQRQTDVLLQTRSAWANAGVSHHRILVGADWTSCTWPKLWHT